MVCLYQGEAWPPRALCLLVEVFQVQILGSPGRRVAGMLLSPALT